MRIHFVLVDLLNVELLLSMSLFQFWVLVGLSASCLTTGVLGRPCSGIHRGTLLHSFLINIEVLGSWHANTRSGEAECSLR